MTSDFESITSSNYAFREEGGRRYATHFPLQIGFCGCDEADDRFHSVEDASYYLPNDEDEVERLQDLQHCIKLFLGRNILPSIASNPSLIGNFLNVLPTIPSLEQLLFTHLLSVSSLLFK